MSSTLAEMELRTTIARASEELEVLIRRAARIGELNVGELLEPYIRLRPSGHLHLDNPRKISLETLAESLRRLPVMFTEVEQVRLVKDLDGFDVQPVPGASWRAGLMSDGSLLIELADGTHSLLGFASTVCALAVEWTKIEQLAGGAGDKLYAPETPDDAMAAAGVDSDAATEPVPDLAEIAFDLGVEEHDLLNASAHCRGVLFELLDRPVAYPRIRIHADLAPSEFDSHGRKLGRAVSETVAELGLQNHAVHLWIGDDIVTDCLSPYARELREPLISWVRSNPDAVGADLRSLQSLVDESTIYAIMRDFFRVDPQVLEERRIADATVGIHRQRIEGLDFEILDLSQIDASLIDARIVEWELDGAPILLRVARPADVDERAFVAELLDTLGMKVLSVTVLLHGTLLRSNPPSTVILPHLLLRWSGEHKFTLPSVHTLAPEDFMGLAQPQSGALLSMPSATLLNAAHIEALADSFNVAALEVGGDGIIAALQDGLWTGRLDSEVAISWPLIEHEKTDDRASVRSLVAASSVAVALLRRIGAPSVASDPPAPEPQRRRSVSSTTMRIRA